MHTPGPWHTRGRIVEGRNHTSAVIPKALAEGEACANARLIASAPELLEALKDAREHLSQYQTYSEDMRDYGRGFVPSHRFTPSYMLGLIDAAIAKATGKE